MSTVGQSLVSRSNFNFAEARYSHALFEANEGELFRSNTLLQETMANTAQEVEVNTSHWATVFSDIKEGLKLTEITAG